MAKPRIFDIETQSSFRDVNNDVRKLKVSVVAAYDFATEQAHAFTESQLSELFKLFEKASVIIGYNSNSFDLAVLNEYYVGDVYRLPHFDLLEDIKEKLGKRLPLDDLVQATLNQGKTGHGLHAIELYKQGKMDELIAYCKDDVRLTRDLFMHGVERGYIYYPDIPKKKVLLVENWKDQFNMQRVQGHNLTLGF